MHAVQLTAYGNPLEGLKYVDIPAPEAPGANQVLIGVEFSPLNQSDLLLAQGIYGARPGLPTVIGNEGVGRVLNVGREVKNVKVGQGAKANHLSYLGDGSVGAGANIGAGTIFCNYDGFTKAETHIGANAFIGSDSTLVAPVTIGAGAYIAAGSSITEDVPEGALAEVPAAAD